MISLHRTVELIEEQSTCESAENSKSILAIRAGLNVNPQFWEEFMQVCNQSSALAELLGVRQEVIGGWSAKIRTGLKQVEQMDRGISTKAAMITTGYN